MARIPLTTASSTKSPVFIDSEITKKSVAHGSVRYSSGSRSGAKRKPSSTYIELGFITCRKSTVWLRPNGRLDEKRMMKFVTYDNRCG